MSTNGKQGDGDKQQGEDEPYLIPVHTHVRAPQFSSLAGINQDALANVWDERRRNFSDNINAIHIIRQECSQKLADKQRELDYYMRQNLQMKQQKDDLEQKVVQKDEEIERLKARIEELTQKTSEQDARIQSQVKAINQLSTHKADEVVKAEQYNEKQQIVIEKLSLELQQYEERAKELEKQVTELNEWKKNAQQNVQKPPPPKAPVIVTLRPSTAKKRSHYIVGETFSNLTRDYVNKKLEEKSVLNTEDAVGGKGQAPQTQQSQNQPNQQQQQQQQQPQQTQSNNSAVKENSPFTNSSAGNAQRTRRSRTMQSQATIDASAPPQNQQVHHHHHQQQQQQHTAHHQQTLSNYTQNSHEGTNQTTNFNSMTTSRGHSYSSHHANDDNAKFKIRQLTNFPGFDNMVVKEARVWSVAGSTGKSHAWSDKQKATDKEE